MYNNFEISLVVFMPNITTNHAIIYTNNHGTSVNTSWHDWAQGASFSYLNSLVVLIAITMHFQVRVQITLERV